MVSVFHQSLASATFFDGVYGLATPRVRDQRAAGQSSIRKIQALDIRLVSLGAYLPDIEGGYRRLRERDDPPFNGWK
jgi:hypothetical protein